MAEENNTGTAGGHVSGEGSATSKPGQSGDVRQADEAGEPGRAGRSHGRVVDEQDPNGQSRTAGDPDQPAGKDAGQGGEHWESGRQRST